MNRRPPREILKDISITFSRYWFTYDAGSHYGVAGWLFLRVLALVYLFQFLSLFSQVSGLIGAEGIYPVRETLKLAAREHSYLAMLKYPTLFWYGAFEPLFSGVLWIGVAFSVLLFVGISPGISLIVLYACFVSFASVGGEFFSSPGDRLLLEAGFIAMFATSFRFWMPFRRSPEPPMVVRILFWWLLFRVHMQSSILEIRDVVDFPAGLALGSQFYQNQPLPTWLAWGLHQLPAFFHWVIASAGLVTRIVFSILIFGPRAYRRMAALILSLCHVLPILAGNYSMFGLLSMAISLLLLDDDLWVRLFPRQTELIEGLQRNKYRGLSSEIRAIAALFIFVATTLTLTNWSRVKPILEWSAPWGLANRYEFDFGQGELRPELLVEGSEDGMRFESYKFKYKPEDSEPLPPTLLFESPRLDWQMARAARESGSYPEWVGRFCQRLLQGSKPVLDLLKSYPFGRTGPARVRFRRYEHRFTKFAERKEGHWVNSLSPEITILTECKKE